MSETDTADNNHAKCGALAAALDLVADKWAIMTIGELSNGPMRFTALVRQIGGVSQKMMTLTLRSLERDGLVTRTHYPTIPPRVEYELTTLGQTLIKPLGELAAWAQMHLPEMTERRRAYDERTDPTS